MRRKECDRHIVSEDFCAVIVCRTIRSGLLDTIGCCVSGLFGLLGDDVAKSLHSLLVLWRVVKRGYIFGQMGG